MPTYTNDNSARIFQRNRYYVTIEKVFELMITTSSKNRNVIMTSYTSSLSIAIKSCKQPSTPMNAEDRRTYWSREKNYFKHSKLKERWQNW